MAKEFWENDKPAAADDFWKADKPAAQGDLPDGVEPSRAGAGRGSVNPTQPAAQPEPSFQDPSGGMDGASIMAVARPERTSVLEGVQMAEPKFDSAEGDRLSNRRYAESTPVPGTPRRAVPVMRASTGPEPTSVATERGAAMQDAPLPVRAAFKAVSGAAQGAGGVIRAAGDFTGSEALQRAGAETVRGAEQFEQGMGESAPAAGFGPKSPLPYLASMGEGAASSLGQSAALASMFGSKALIPLMSVMSAGQEYDKARSAGLDPATALAGAVPKGAFEAIGEKFSGLDKVAGAMGTLLTKGASAEARRGAADILVKSGVKEIPGEVITYLGQTGVDMLPGIGLNPDLSMGQFVDGLRDTVVQSAMMGTAMGTGGAVVRTDPRIKRLRDAGETGAADLLQQKLDQHNQAATVEGELGGMAPLAEFAATPEFQTDYRALRTEGVKPVEAAGRSALTSRFRTLATGAGMSEKAMNAALDGAKKIGLDKMPGFLQRYTQALAAKGVMQPPQGVDGLGAALEATRDTAMNAAMGVVYQPEPEVRQTMADVQALENAQTAQVDAGKDQSDPQKAGSDPQNTEFDAGNDVLVTPETDRVHAAATSPLNDLPEPSQAQKEAGNYRLGRMRIAGMDIAVENPQGSVRRGTDADGNPWESPMRHHYGYFNGTAANDGDKLDVFVQPGTGEDYRGPVYVVDQIDPKTGELDEHKVLIGPQSEADAEAMYRSNYDAGWQGLGAITRLPMPAFKAWAKSGTLKEPLGDITAKAPATLDPTPAPAAAALEVQSADGAQPAAPVQADPLADAVNVQNTPPRADTQTQAAPVEAPANDGGDATGQAAAGAEARSGAVEAARVILGRNNVPMSEGGKAFKTRQAADDARKLQPMMRVVRADGGYALTEKSPAQLAAQEKAARRLRNPQTSAAGEPIPAHAMIASAGGLSPDERADMGIDGNVTIGNRKLFAGVGKGLTMERATEKLIEDGYLPEGAGHDQARALIKRSLSQPQYTAEGFERLAESETQARFDAAMAEDDAVAQIEALSDNQFDALDAIPWDDDSNTSTEAAMRALGFTDQEISDAIANESRITPADSAGRDRLDEAAASAAQEDSGSRAQETQRAEEVNGGVDAGGDARPAADGRANRDKPGVADSVDGAGASGNDTRHGDGHGADGAGRARDDGSAAAVTQTPADAGVSTPGTDFPPVTQFDRINVGPGGFIKPRAVAPGQPTYRETDVGGLDDHMREDRQAVPYGGFVADREALAIGQGLNRGVHIVFRADAVSGRQHAKPMTGDLAGREYKADLLAPRAVQAVTLYPSDLKRARTLTRQRLAAEFTREELPDGRIRFNRKGLPTLPAPQPIEMTWEMRPSGTLSVKGDPIAIRARLADLPPRSLMVSKDGMMVGKTQVARALELLGGKPADPVAGKPLTVGIMPGNAEPVTVKDGVVYIGKNEAVDFDSGEPVTVADGATDQQIADALRDAGALSRRQRVFGLAKGEQDGLTAPTKEDVLAQQQAREDGAKAEAKAKIEGERKAQADADLADFTLTGSNRSADIAAAGGQNGLFAKGDLAEEHGESYTAPYETDLFGDPLPESHRAARTKRSAQAGLRGNAQPAESVSDERPPGDYFTDTVVGTEVLRRLGADRVLTADEAAQATRYLYRSAVERFDAIVTDKNHKPLAVVGGFKGAVSQTSVYPATVMAEAIRIPGAAHIWFSHNHPSGRADLSVADENLNKSMSDVFRGSGIKPMGLLAIGKDSFGFVNADGTPWAIQKIRESTTETTVPSIERRLVDSASDNSNDITTPRDARSIGERFYKKQGGPGVMLLNANNSVIAWLPVGDLLKGKLRNTGGLAQLYKAVSHSNASAAIIVHGGELGNRTDLLNRVTPYENIMAALAKVDVRPLDVIDIEVSASLAELGREVKSGPVYARGFDADAFKRHYGVVKGMTVAEAKKVTDRVSAKWENGPRIIVVDTVRDLPVKDVDARARGLYTKDAVYIVASNNQSADWVARTLAHEAIAHHGLRQALGPKDWAALMRNIQLAIKSGNKPLGELQDYIQRTYKDQNLSPNLEADEIAARAVEQAVDPVTGDFRPGFGFLKQAYARIAQWLRSIGIDVPFTMAELHGMLVAAMKSLEVGHRTQGGGELVVAAARSESPVSVPEVMIGNALGAATAHPDYAAAKAGDTLAAVKVAKALVTDDLVERVRQSLGDSQPILVPVVSEEATGRNQIPRAAAAILANKLGLTRTSDIYQSNRPHRTELKGLDRIFAGPEFDGPVVPGRVYLLVDDTLTQGATFAALASHIEQGGGVVQGAVALTGKQYSATLEPSADTLKKLREKHGDLENDFRAATGYGFDALTQSEARYLTSYEPAQSVRDRILAESREAGGRGDRQDSGRGQPPVLALGGTGNLFQPTIWNTPDPTRVDRVIYELQDGKVDLKRVQEAITKSGQTITEQWDARLAETLYPGRVAYRSATFLDAEAKPLLEAMARNKVPMDELADYLHARGAEERNAQIAKVNPNMPDGGAGTNSKGVLLTNQAARDYLAHINPARKVVLDAMAKRVDAITAGTRQLLVTEGLEKQDTIDAWEAAYKNYVPMFRDEAETGLPPHPQGSGFAVKGSASKRATGSTKEVTNILAHVLMQREAAITRAEKNRVALALYGQALSHPNPDFWTTIKPGMSAAQIGAELQAMGVDPMTAEVGMQGVPTIRTVDPVTNKVVDRPNPIYRNMPGAIPLKVNGEDRVLMLNVKGERGQRLAESLKNLDGLTQLDLAGSIIGKSTRWLAAVNTQYNPAFGLVNLTRDTLGGAINLGSTELRGNALKVLAQTPVAILGIARELANGGQTGKWQTLYRQFQADGGQTGFKENFRDPNDRAKAVEKELASLGSGKLSPGRVAHAMLDLLDGFNTTLENAVRLSAYKSALDKGISRAEAARLGRELTVDFNRKGRAGREVGPLYAFFNASVQGSARTLEALKGPTGGRIIAGGLSLGILQALMLAAAGYDDDEIPEFVKTRALIIPLFGKDKHYMAIPYPLGLHVLPNTGRVLAELTLNGGKDIGKRTVDAIGEIAGAFNPLGGGNVFTADGALKTVAPTLVDPVIEVGFNKNFAGGQIEKQGYGSETDGRPGVARTKESTMRSTTGQVYMVISKAINTLTGGTDYQAGVLSPTPERVRYIAQTAGGGVLRELEKTVNASTAAARGDKVKMSAIPVAGRFYGEVDDDQVQTSRYFNGAKKLKALESSLSAAKQAGDGEAMTRMIEQHPEIAFLKAQAKVQADISKLNKAAVSTVGSPETTRDIDKARVETMKGLNAAIEELEKANGKVTLGDRFKKAIKPQLAEATP